MCSRGENQDLMSCWGSDGQTENSLGGNTVVLHLPDCVIYPQENLDCGHYPPAWSNLKLVNQTKTKTKPHRRIKDWKVQCDKPPSFTLPLPALGQFSNQHFVMSQGAQTLSQFLSLVCDYSPSQVLTPPSLSSFSPRAVTVSWGLLIVWCTPRHHGDLQHVSGCRLCFGSGCSGALSVAPQDTAEPSQLTHCIWVPFCFFFFYFFLLPLLRYCCNSSYFCWIDSTVIINDSSEQQDRRVL